MMNMMTPTGLPAEALAKAGMTRAGSAMFWLHLHWAFGLFAIVGFILLTVWALKNLKGDQLKSTTTWLLAIGIIGTLATAPLAASGLAWLFGPHRGTMSPMMNPASMGGMMDMMEMMMEHDDEAQDEDHGEMLRMMQKMSQ